MKQPASEDARPYPRSTVVVSVAEGLLIFLLLLAAAGSPPPDVNEAHYLAKAKNYWDPQWCRGDLFLESADAHWVFYWTFGWLTRWLSLPAVAWAGRLLTWAGLAWSWRRLSWSVVPRPLASVLSAALLVVLTRNFHMAGEWLVGGVEAKGFAYVFMLLGLEALVRGRWRAVWLLLGIATAFHVLVGGWSLIAAGFTWLCRPHDRLPLWSMLPAMVLGACLALPGVLPALSLSSSSNPRYVDAANLVYVFFRLDHHLVFHRFQPGFVVRHGLLLAVAALLAARLWHEDVAWRRLTYFIGGCIAIGLIGIAIDQLSKWQPDIAAGLLRYYWFRLTDIMIPASVALGIPLYVSSIERDRRGIGRGLAAAALVLSLGIFGYPLLVREWPVLPPSDQQNFEQRSPGAVDVDDRYAQWRQVCAWIREHTPRDAQFLTPRYQQTFKWYAERAEIFSFKDIPQDAEGIVEWWRRERRIFPGDQDALGDLSDTELLELCQAYGADYIVVDRSRTPRRLGLPRVYPNPDDVPSLYEVYRVP